MSAVDVTTQDAFLDGRVMVLQPKSAYRAGLDAVLLAATVPTVTPHTSSPRILDLGAGVGTVGLCVAARIAAVDVVLLEREPVLVLIAHQNIVQNGLEARVRVVEADLGLAAEVVGLAADSFDYCLANPPFLIEGQGRPSTDPLKARAHAMPEGDLDRWVRTMARLTKASGVATMIHRADALAEILAAFQTRFGAVAVLPVYARDGDDAVRVLVSGIKGSRAPLRILPGLVLHQAGSQAFTPRLQAILRNGAPLDLSAT